MEVHAGYAAPSPDTSLGDSFAWPMRDPEWAGKLVLMGLISLIPILGWLQLLGWMLASLDNLRQGHQVLPPAGFRYASRGVNVFVASLVWGLIVGILIYGSMFAVLVGLVAVSPRSNTQSGSEAFPLVFFPVMFGTVALFGMLILVLYVFVPVVIMYTDRAGLGGAFNVAGFIHAIRTSPSETLAAGALAIVSYFISGLGTYLCYVGLLFTIPYSMALMAGVLRWYEVHAKPGALPAVPQVTATS
jgi:uncharacterized protein DUF4013